MDKDRVAARQPHIDRLDIDHGVNDTPLPRHQSRNAQQGAPGYLWNSTTQELIPILPEDHPDYRQNQEDRRCSTAPLEPRDVKMTDPQTVAANPAPLTRQPARCAFKTAKFGDVCFEG